MSRVYRTTRVKRSPVPVRFCSMAKKKTNVVSRQSYKTNPLWANKVTIIQLVRLVDMIRFSWYGRANCALEYSAGCGVHRVWTVGNFARLITNSSSSEWRSSTCDTCMATRASCTFVISALPGRKLTSWHVCGKGMQQYRSLCPRGFWHWQFRLHGQC